MPISKCITTVEIVLMLGLHVRKEDSMTEKITPQADEGRLLTRQERDDVYDSIPVEDGGTVGAERLAFCKAQDAKSYTAGLAEGREKALKELFTSEELHHLINGLLKAYGKDSEWEWCAFCDTALAKLEALKEGRLP